ncbi:hypothetical protein CCR91_13215, partial [Thiorhodovibrio winogradskyi]|nr:hypothetical protein [Thiorhodovibrio winogradskyi]
MQKILNERFLFIDDQAVASGGTADVYETYDIQQKQSAAVKLFKKDFASDQDPFAKESYYREIKSLFDLNTDENIVKLLDHGCDPENDRLYIAVEWVPYDLQRFTREHPVESWTEYYECFGKPILNALSFAYSRGILHRDVTPNNILVTSDGKVKIADFGISKFKRSFGSGVTLATFKTAPYAPPENSFDYPDVRDVFSFVITSLEVLLGKNIEDHAHARHFLENDLICPDPIRTVLDKAIDIDPERRPANILELAEQLAETAVSVAAALDSGRIIGTIITNKVVESVSTYTLQRDAYSIQRLILDDLNSGVLFKQHMTRLQNGKKSISPDTYNLVSSDFSYLARRDQADPSYLALLQCQKINPVAIEIIQKKAIALNYRFDLHTNVNTEESNENIDAMLLNLNGELNRIEREYIENQRNLLLTKWRDALDIRKDIERLKEDPIYFSSVDFDGQRIILKPEKNQYIENDCIGQPRLIKDQDKVSASGEIEWIDENGIILFCEDPFDQEAVPSKGRLTFDTNRSRAAIRKQENALDVLQQLKSARADLKALLLEPEKQSAPKLAEVKFFQSDLDDSKRDAVKVAVGADDVLVVEGPPGTGKTKFITEVILQHFLLGQKVLLTSQTHNALDNALERLQAIFVERNLDIQMVRIGHKDDKRVAQTSRKLLLEFGVAKWIDSVKVKSATGLEKWAKENGVELHKVRIASDFAKLRRLIEESERYRIEIDSLQKEEEHLNSEIDSLKRDPTVKGSVPALRDHLGEATRQLSILRAVQKVNEKEKGEAYKKLSQVDGFGNSIYSLDLHELDEYEEYYIGSNDSAKSCRAILELIEDWNLRLICRKEFQSAYLSSAQVVAGTCVGVAAAQLNNIEFDVCIVDEASKALPTEMLVPMVRAKKWIIVGDTKQLPPYLGDFMEHKSICERYSFTRDDYRATLLDHLVKKLPDHSKRILVEQYRMAKPIGDLVSHCFYNGQLRSNKPFSAEVFVSIPLPITIPDAAVSLQRHDKIGDALQPNPERLRSREPIGFAVEKAAQGGDH